jgi:hypothetical protein
VPEGSADLKSATFGDDTVHTAQFLFNTWDAWAPSNAGMVSFDLVSYNFETKAIDDVTACRRCRRRGSSTVPNNSRRRVQPPRDLDVISY